MTRIQHIAFVFSFAFVSVGYTASVDSSAGACGDASDKPLVSEQLYWQRLDEIRSERNFSDSVVKGTFKGSHKLDGFARTFHYIIDVPDTYDPKQMTDLHIYLHGGVGISSTRISNVKMRRLKKLRIDGAISVYPSAWSAAKWWYESQARNVIKIINTLKASYNINENRVFLHGLSDGAAGVYYFASHLPTPFAGFVALLGSPHVLRPKHNVFGTTFAGNFVNKPIFALNTEDDHLFPADSVEKLFEAVNDSDGSITFYAMPGDHFGMPWLSVRKMDYEDFVDRNTRNPYPDSLFWQTDEESQFNRIHWLVLNGTLEGDTDSAVVARKYENAIYLSSKNVSAVTLLISSDHFDLMKKIQVWYKGKNVFDQRVSPRVEVLDKWFRLDEDRSMLFAAEICLDVL